jgi:GGDEF domain-containing protein
MQPTYNELQNENTELKSLIETLITDKIFNVYTRQGLDIKISELGNDAKFLVFIDVDKMHDANEQYGYEGTNTRIKNSLDIRSTDIVIKSRWFSGDELIILTINNPVAMLKRLHQNFIDNGLSITSAFTVFTGDLEENVKVCSDKVQAAKSNNTRGIIAE